MERLMSEFKVGDDVWFFWTDCGKYAWDEDTTIIYPDRLYIETGTIVEINPNKDFVNVYVKGHISVCQFGYNFVEKYLFKSKNDAIDAMIKEIQEFKD